MFLITAEIFCIYSLDLLLLYNSFLRDCLRQEGTSYKVRRIIAASPCEMEQEIISRRIEITTFLICHKY